MPKAFIRIENGSFVQGDEDKRFFPVVVNYMLSAQTDGKEIWPTAFKQYHRNQKSRYTSKDSCLQELKIEFQHIKSLGFNSIRLVQFGEAAIDWSANSLAVWAQFGNDSGKSFYLDEEENYNSYVKATKELFKLANEAGLKVIYLVRTKPDLAYTEDFLQKYLAEFNTDTNILAWDLFNEPLYFDTLERPKTDIIEIANRWSQWIEKTVPNHLTTIGLTGIKEVFEWDASLLPVDFISFHPYPYEPNQVLNEMRWYKSYIDKPWIIGETSIASEGETTEEMQAEFAREVIDQTIAAGGIGFSWWQYKDVDWGDPVSDKMGLVALDSVIEENNLVFDRREKPVCEVFKQLNQEEMLKGNIPLREPNNYYNYSGFSDFRLKGTLLDQSGNPLDGGVIMGWSQWWEKSYASYCKSDGTFELFGPFEYYHWIISAPGFESIKRDCDPNAAIEVNGIKTLDLGEIKLDKL
ncbi:MAG: hypothetical protein ACPF8V_03715 [Luteibaculum sp.]